MHSDAPSQPEAALFRPLTAGAIAECFTMRARLQGMLDFEAALAQAEAQAGVIPLTALQSIRDACHADVIDAQALAADAASAGNLAIPLVRQLTRAVAQRDEVAARYVHWGATSQDVIDTGCVLQLRAALDRIESRLAALCRNLATLADAHRDTVMVGRTWMQHALPISFGLKLAGWLDALGRDRDRLRALRPRLLTLQFGGAVGTLAALGERAPAVSRGLADILQLALPATPWHGNRDRMAECATTLGLLTGTLGKIARDLALLAQTEVGEVEEPTADGRGGSSTMPHKRNPVAAAAVLAAAQRVPGLVATMLAAQVQEHERALGGWQAEWQTLPEIVQLAGGALAQLEAAIEGLTVHADRMRENIGLTHGLVMAEAVSIALAARLGRQRAHERVEQACHRALAEQRTLRAALHDDAVVMAELPVTQLDALLDPVNYLGMARQFIDQVLADHAGREAAARDGTDAT